MREYKHKDIFDHEKDYRLENKNVFHSVKWPWIADFIRKENLSQSINISHDSKITDSEGSVLSDYFEVNE